MYSLTKISEPEKRSNQTDQAFIWSLNDHKVGYTGYGKANKPKVNRNILILVA